MSCYSTGRAAECLIFRVSPGHALVHAESLGQRTCRVAESAGNWQDSGTGWKCGFSCSPKDATVLEGKGPDPACAGEARNIQAL